MDWNIICKGKADINNDIDINDNVSALNVVKKAEGYQIHNGGTASYNRFPKPI